MNNNYLTQDEDFLNIVEFANDNTKEKVSEMKDDLNETSFEISKELLDNIISITAQTGNLNIEWSKFMHILEIKIDSVSSILVIIGLRSNEFKIP